MTTTTLQSDPKQQGAQPANRSAFRHGLRSSRWPAGFSYQERQCNLYRRVLEDVVLAQRGEIDVIDAGTIHSAVQWAAHGAKAAKWLADGADLSPSDKLNHSREIARASTERDRAVKALGLDQHHGTADMWATIHGTVVNGAQLPADSTPAPESPSEPISRDDEQNGTVDSPTLPDALDERTEADSGDETEGGEQ